MLTKLTSITEVIWQTKKNVILGSKRSPDLSLTVLLDKDIWDNMGQPNELTVTVGPTHVDD